MKARDNKKGFLFKVALIWLLGNFCFFKNINFLFETLFKAENLSFGFSKILLPIGISYILFRLIHYIVEVYRGNILPGSFINFALYILFFPTFLAGPIERYSKFSLQSEEIRNLNSADINYGLSRIILGVLKKFIADQIFALVMPIFLNAEAYTGMYLITCIYVLAVQLYMDFSGYSDIAIGCARLFGYRIIENFDRPFIKSNIALFWRSWHISLYNWIRDYFFLPIFGYRPSKIKTYLGIFSVMFVFMLWHRFSLNFFILAVYHGLGLVAWYFFQDLKRRYPSLRNLVLKPYLYPLSVFVTFSFFSFSSIFFVFSVSESLKIISNIIRLG